MAFDVDLIIKSININNKLERLRLFGAIQENDSKLSIVGKIIEKYGRELCDNPIKRINIFKWLLLFVVLGCSSFIYFYFNPQTKWKEYIFDSGIIKMGNPATIELQEQGNFTINIINNSTSTIKDVYLFFNSGHIRYLNSNNTNTLYFSEINPKESTTKDINFIVDKQDNNETVSSILLRYLNNDNKLVEKEINDFKIKNRIIALKPFSLFISIIISLIGVTIPGKDWKTIFIIVLKLFNVKQEESG